VCVCVCVCVVLTALFWSPPELLRDITQPRNGTQAGDVYSVGILFFNILYRLPPYQTDDYSALVPRGRSSLSVPPCDWSWSPLTVFMVRKTYMLRLYTVAQKAIRLIMLFATHIYKTQNKRNLNSHIGMHTGSTLHNPVTVTFDL